jgi:hypothetical protein
LREEDKEEGVGLGEGDFLLGGEGETREEKGKEANFLGGLLLVDWVAGILGLGARKSDFLELGSQRGSVPSWLGGKHSVFRQFQALGSFWQQTVSTSQGTTSPTCIFLFYCFS